MKELPRYKQHKEVSALKIKEVSIGTDRETLIDGIRVVFEDESYPSLFFSHMSKAAKVLNTVQPVISRSIAELEYALGVRLLDRGRQGVKPTEYD